MRKVGWKGHFAYTATTRYRWEVSVILLLEMTPHPALSVIPGRSLVAQGGLWWILTEVFHCFFVSPREKRLYNSFSKPNNIFVIKEKTKTCRSVWVLDATLGQGYRRTTSLLLELTSSSEKWREYWRQNSSKFKDWLLCTILDLGDILFYECVLVS